VNDPASKPGAPFKLIEPGSRERAAAEATAAHVIP